MTNLWFGEQGSERQLSQQLCPLIALILSNNFSDQPSLAEKGVKYMFHLFQ